MRRTEIWIERVGDRTYAISTERHDPYLYVADTFDQLLRAYEEDWHCKVSKVYDITKTNWKEERHGTV